MYYISNERDYYSLSTGIYSFLRINMKANKLIEKCIFLTHIFQSSISHQIMSLSHIFYTCR